MRHRRSIPKLGVKTAHRKAILSNMATSLINHGQIETTVSRAKAIIPVVSHLITLAKRGDIHARRTAALTIKDKAVLQKLFSEIAGEFKSRSGGYARLIRSGFRKGDGASLAVVQLLIEKKVEEKETAKEKGAAKEKDDAKDKGAAAEKGAKKEKVAKEKGAAKEKTAKKKTSATAKKESKKKEEAAKS